MENIIEIGAVLTASALAMILHELPKSIMYILTGRHCQPEDKRRIFRLHQYIDPVGWILFLVCHAGCSKPYPYRLKEKDTNIAIGLTGFLSLGVMIAAGYVFYYNIIPYLPLITGWTLTSPLLKFVAVTSWFFLYASCVLLIINLFPTTASDMFLLIIGIAPSKLIYLLKNDAMIKGLLIFAIILGLIPYAAGIIMNGIGYLTGIV